MSAKYNFLKDYMSRVKTHEDKDIDRALEFLTDFWEGLPERSRGPERRKQWATLVNELVNAFDKQIEKLADCPFVKIEISNQTEIKDLLVTLKTYADIDFLKKTKVEEEKRYGNQRRNQKS